MDASQMHYAGYVSFILLEWDVSEIMFNCVN
jgi:hypothetical protein